MINPYFLAVTEITIVEIMLKRSKRIGTRTFPKSLKSIINSRPKVKIMMPEKSLSFCPCHSDIFILSIENTNNNNIIRRGMT